ncbi:asparaginase [Novosphingobium marinum]|uniref:L-asparaginase n=1 Tax=Novosphingobium marinum TaxID=1514948 RepID=A0A7Y9XYC8_9SPHN|nr:asparaginase domain-containing protein [Novosphingobium marinum]NYH96812.1 L-asparaginase [Novosphingobium marinum]GGC40054.1 asparaginase [Novosphingobium marinum]
MDDDEAILILTTGGTIDKQYFDAKSEFQIADTMISHLLEEGRVRQSFRIEEAMRKDSLELDDADRAAIRDRIGRAPERRIVVTHGTDTMTETARALVGLDARTIVLVGALAPARFAQSDAAFNLGMAFACAQVARPGIYITMNGTVFDGLKVRKDREAGAFVRLD